MDYAAALEYITSTGRFGIKLGLERTRALLDEAGSPERGMRGVLVAGTNGKGSTCAFISSILRSAGLRVAQMPKPHLVSYTERVVVDGRPIDEEAFAAEVTRLVPAINRVAAELGPPTEFEILTTLALRYAAGQGADLLVCEVGMGGRLDATNVTDLGVKVITGVDLDHQAYLGNTVEEIAAEKAGIIAPGDVVLAGRMAPSVLAVVTRRCAEMGAQLRLAGRDWDWTSRASGWEGVEFDFTVSPSLGMRPLASLRSPMLGGHQVANAALAVATVQAMAVTHGVDVTDEAIRDGLAGTRWPGRLELFPGAPAVLLDGGHNPAATAAVVTAARELMGDRAPVVLFGAMADKDYAAMLAQLPHAWRAVFTAVPEARALPAEQLLQAARGTGREGDTAVEGVASALSAARETAGPGGVVLVLGSLYLAGEVRRLIAAAGG